MKLDKIISVLPSIIILLIVLSIAGFILLKISARGVKYCSERGAEYLTPMCVDPCSDIRKCEYENGTQFEFNIEETNYPSTSFLFSRANLSHTASFVAFLSAMVLSMVIVSHYFDSRDDGE